MKVKNELSDYEISKIIKAYFVDHYDVEEKDVSVEYHANGTASVSYDDSIC